MAKYTSFLATVFIAALVGGSIVHFSQNNATNSPIKESAYNRVLRTGVLRCGYADWPPYVFVKDPTTGKTSGIFVEVTEAVAAKLNIKVEWTANTGWGSMAEDMRGQRFDAFCAGAWRDGQRGRFLTYTMPVFYGSNYPYVAIDDHRFDKDLAIVNDPTIRISTMDGETSDQVAQQFFPKATKVSIPQLGQITDILTNVADRKADIVFTEPSFVNGFMEANPGKLRRAQNTPFQTFPTCLAVEIHETELRDMLDSALAELHSTGVIDRIISKYSTDPAVFLRVAKPYAQMP